MKKITLVSFACINLMSWSVNAGTLKYELAKCVQEQDSLARLVCFDNLAKNAELSVAQERGSISAPAIRIAPAAESVVSKEDSFGVEHLKKTNVTENDLEVVFVVEKLKEDRYGKLRFLFKNGQQWKQSDSKYFKVKVGDSLLLKKGFMGAVYLKKNNPDSNKKIRVKRLK